MATEPIAAHQVLVANNAQAAGGVSPSTAGYVLTSNGASADPSFQAPAPGGDTFIKAYRTIDCPNVNNSSVLVADDTLKFAIGANEAWWISGKLLFYSPTNTPGIYLGFTGPAGATLIQIDGTNCTVVSPFMLAAYNSATPALDLIVLNAFTTLADPNSDPNTAVLFDRNSFSADKVCPVDFSGLIINGATSGTVNVAYAQQTPTAENTVPAKAGSTLIAHKLSA